MTGTDIAAAIDLVMVAFFWFSMGAFLVFTVTYWLGWWKP
jgi:hypothetical protein